MAEALECRRNVLLCQHLFVAKPVKLVQVAKAFLKWQGKLSQFFVLEDYKEKRKAKAVLGDSEQTGAKQSFKSTELVDSDSNKEEEEDRVCIIKKIKCEHVEELTGIRQRKEIIELEDEEVEIVAPKTPMAEPSRQISKPVVVIPSTPKPIPKPIVALTSPVAGPSAAPIVPDSASKPAATAPLSNSAPVKSTVSAIKGSFIFKDPFMVRQFKLVGTEESRALIINQATEVSATQETLQDEDSSDENDKDGNDNEDNSDNDDAAMDVASAKCPEETRPTVPTKATVTKVKALAPVSKIKHEHAEELTGARKEKEIIVLEDLEDEMVVPKTPAVGPSHQTLKPMVLVSSMPNSAPKPTATAPVSKPAPVKSADKPAIKRGSVFKDPFMVRQFKLVGIEESGALIINQATEVATGKVTSIAIQETLQDKETSNEDDNNKDSNDNEGGKGDDDDSNNDDAAMDVDSSISKKIKHEHAEELTGARKEKEIIVLEDLEDEMVVPKTPAVGPSHQTLKPMVLVSSMPNSAPKPTATAPVSKPAPVKSADKPAIKRGSVFKDPFMVRQFKLVGIEESGALIINQATEVATGKVTSIAIQETLQDKETSNEDDNNKDSNDNEGGKGDDDDSNNDDAAMDVDS
ncbi:hypothetical protein C0995_002962, partial [Termitomyces sp. Mi166